MDIEFINKRIQEQKDHIEELMATPMDALRKIELLKSARGQLTYFETKRFFSECKCHNPYRDELKNVLGPEQEFQSLAAAITTPFSVAQAIHG